MRSFPWGPRKQKSNSVAALVLNDNGVIPGRPGFAIVVDGFTARTTNPAAPTKPGQVIASVTDSATSSFALGAVDPGGLAGGTPNATISVEKTTPHVFGEGTTLSVNIAGTTENTTCGYTIDWHYEPCPIGFTGL